jgi:hypothetical protein
MPVLLGLIVTFAMQTAAPSPITVIANDMMSQVDSARQSVARTAAEWTALWKMHSGESTPPAVDLRSRTVVAVFLGSRPTAGYAVQIIGTRQAKGALIVQWQERRPASGDILAQVLTSPAAIASIPKFAGEIKFEKVDPK